MNLCEYTKATHADRLKSPIANGLKSRKIGQMSYAAQLRGAKRNKLFLTPHDLMEAAADYFEWCEEHPILEEQVNIWQGVVIRTDISKVRSFTIRGLATYLGLTAAKIKSYGNKGAEWEEVLEFIDQVIYTQKFENAAAGMLNPTMITRDLGLVDKQDVKTGITVTFAGKDEDL